MHHFGPPAVTSIDLGGWGVHGPSRAHCALILVKISTGLLPEVLNQKMWVLSEIHMDFWCCLFLVKPTRFSWDFSSSFPEVFAPDTQIVPRPARGPLFTVYCQCRSLVVQQNVWHFVKRDGHRLIWTATGFSQALLSSNHSKHLTAKLMSSRYSLSVSSERRFVGKKLPAPLPKFVT